MRRLTGFAVINCEVGKKIAYTYSILDSDGNITKSNIKESFLVIDEDILNAIAIIENSINKRVTK